MKYSLALYEKAIPAGKTFPEMFAITKEGGFDRLEISIDESDARLARLDWPVEKQRDLGRMALDAGTPITTMCLSGHRKYPFGSHDPAVRSRSVDIMHKAVDFAANSGIRLIQLAGYDVYYEDEDESTAENFLINLKDAAVYAASAGIMLGFETMETPFMDTVAKAMHYVSLVNSAYLGVYPDIGNLKNAAVLYGGDVVKDMETGRGHIFAVHLKETKPGLYRNMNFGDPTGHTEYIPDIRCALSMGVRMFTGEFWYQEGQDCTKTIRAASSFLKDKIETAAKGE
jgi:predicted hexulose-6-phosphate isomerase